jgi:phosphoglycerate dehydrogenase-like enzyme
MKDLDKIIEVLITVPIPENLLAELRQVSPQINITLLPVNTPADIPSELWQRVEVLYTLNAFPEPEWVPNLRWIQLYVSGADYAMTFPIVQQPNILVTTLSGSNSIMVAEFTVMLLLIMSHNMQGHIYRQQNKTWIPDQWNQPNLRQLHGSTVGLVGYGSIGRQIAHFLTTFDVNILAAKKDLKHLRDTGFYFKNSGDPEGDLFNRMYPIKALKSMLRVCDFVVVSLPLTSATKGLIGEDELTAMKKDACLIVVGRGGVVNEQALLKALINKSIAGAALDVFAEEPLARENPLWEAPNLLITPHIAGIGPNYARDGMALFCENMKRYIDGTPLYNRLDLKREY